MKKTDKIKVTLTIEINMANSKKENWAKARDYLESELNDIATETLCTFGKVGEMKVGEQYEELSKTGNNYSLRIDNI